MANDDQNNRDYSVGRWQTAYRKQIQEGPIGKSEGTTTRIEEYLQSMARRVGRAGSHHGER